MTQTPPSDLAELSPAELIDVRILPESLDGERARALHLPRPQGDLPRLREVFQNLLTNAVRYRSPDSEEPFVAVKASREQDWVHCVVWDNGIGIDEPFHERSVSAVTGEP